MIERDTERKTHREVEIKRKEGNRKKGTGRDRQKKMKGREGKRDCPEWRWFRRGHVRTPGYVGGEFKLPDAPFKDI